MPACDLSISNRVSVDDWASKSLARNANRRLCSHIGCITHLNLIYKWNISLVHFSFNMNKKVKCQRYSETVVIRNDTQLNYVIYDIIILHLRTQQKMRERELYVNIKISIHKLRHFHLPFLWMIDLFHQSMVM